MKIVQLTAENIKKLKVVDITPTKDFIQITGKNGSGKTSVLDSIWWALGGKDAIQEHPIRKGEQKAIIRLDLGECVVTRRFSESGTTLVVESADGFRAASPQAMLDKIIGHLAFDPLEFSRMGSKAQFDTLRKIADVKIDFEQLAYEDKKDFDDRHIINREIKSLRGQLEGLGTIKAPDAPIDVQKLLAQLSEIENMNAASQAKNDELSQREKAWHSMGDRIKLLKQELADLEEKYNREEILLSDMEALEIISTDEVKQQIANAQSHNESYRLGQQHLLLTDKIAAKEKESFDLTGKMNARKEQRLKAIKESKMPVSGLSFGDDEVLFNDIPIYQLSSAEQIRVSIAIAMAANPKLRVIRIKDGSLLDDDSLKIIQQMAIDNDYQIWCERVNDSGKVGIVMEDGEIIANNEGGSK